jgi:hypothetical protein
MQPAALGRQVHLTADLFEQGPAHGLAQPGHLHGHAGLGEMHGLGGPGKTAMPDHGLEDFQLAQGDAPGEFASSRDRHGFSIDYNLYLIEKLLI